MTRHAAVVAGGGRTYHQGRVAEEPVMTVVELDTAPDTIEASLNYLADTGEKLVTQVAEPGGRDSRSGGGSETHRVAIHNGRPLAERFEFEREGFRFVDQATKVANFADEDEIR